MDRTCHFVFLEIEEVVLVPSGCNGILSGGVFNKNLTLKVSNSKHIWSGKISNGEFIVELSEILFHLRRFYI